MRTETRTLTAVAAVLGLIGAISANAISAAIDPEWSRKNIWTLGVAAFVFVVGAALLLRRWRSAVRVLGARAVATVDTCDGVMEAIQVTRSGSALVSSYAQNGTWSAWTDLGS